MKYKRGDFVRVRDDLSRRERYYMEGKDGILAYSNTVTSEMQALAGTFQEIESIRDGQYILRNFSVNYRWTDGMFQDDEPYDAGVEEDYEFSEDGFLNLIFG